jgi:hypothetical protein
MEQADILTGWLRAGNSNYPTLEGTYALESSSDITGQPNASIPSEPNNHVLRIHAETAVMDLIAQDPNYTILEGTRHGI